MKNFIFKEKNVTAEFLPSGDLVGITANGMMINQLVGQAFDGSLTQLYLRVHHKEEIISTPMIGSDSKSQFMANHTGAFWKGTFAGVTYKVAFTMNNQGIWFWTVSLIGDGQQKVDVIYGQDLGNASPGAVLSNEAYMSQYLDHKVTSLANGFVISSRQNQTQNGKFPVVEQGSLSKTIGFVTDGYQFFGKEYKRSNQPQALAEPYLANEVYQYEFAYTALQSEAYVLDGKAVELVFYGVTKDNQITSVEEPLFEQDLIKTSYEPVNFPDFQGVVPIKLIGEPISGESLTLEEVNAWFPERKLTEYEGDELLSFFTPNHHHVVLQEKEVRQERATGHILLSGMDLTVEIPPLSSTVYMYGIFNSQVVLGNTSMNKLMSNSRNSLNVQKLTGQRIYLKDGDEWRNLGLPSAFEMGLNSAVWYYKLPDDVLVISSYTVAAGHEIKTTFESQQKRVYTIAITNHFLMGASDESHAVITKQGCLLTIQADDNSPIQEEYPELTYYVNASDDYVVGDESLFGIPDNRLTVLMFSGITSVQLDIQGSLTGAEYQKHDTSQKAEDKIFSEYIDDLIKHFELQSERVEVESINTLIRWYTHNMLVHYLSPHGLEQYGGAAWGTRDVSQGPTEFFLTMDRPEVVKSIIMHVFSNQFSDDGNWPQWFMFDRYETQKADESHGDVIVWPMKIIADYLAKTGDVNILKEQLPYSDRETLRQTQDRAPLMEHLRKEIAYIEANFLPGTYLSCYGDGDWDDTLQPNDSKMKKQMASSWTVALTYQVLQKLSVVIEPVDSSYANHLAELAVKIKHDFEKYMLGTEVIPGFVYLEEGRKPELMIHPTDSKTGVHYRLLPMTRSMIAGLLTPEVANSHYELIKKRLYFPDGVRLMDRPAHYHGGVSTNFKRAEQAANFGREIGLQYVHAHIRFTEAMAKLGKQDETWKALQMIDPIQIKDRVENAQLRQANVYFSSSDGNFKTRYEAQENFGKLKDGSVDVKGGWRIYSSGPGIYISQLIASVLGVRESVTGVVFDPILPIAFDGASLIRVIAGKRVKIIYRLGNDAQDVVIDGMPVVWQEEENPYRAGGMQVMKEVLDDLLHEGSKIEIYR